MEHRVRDVSVASFQQNLESNGGGGGGGGSSSAGGVEEHVVRWERFLPRRNLRVLLVENDDSTRHIVSALLRKCSYQVAAVADGLKAWKVLKERHYNFDLVLTEVVMPSLSGIGLLSKIMSNEICKNIPVIMMSSHDSIGIVFKCMMKGAADFLVKPVRKNELRNLWQHVWRKCCASNGGDGFENENIIDTKAEGAPDNEAASNYASSNAGNRSKIGDNSEESDSQSSCSRPDIRTESMQKQEDPVHNDYRRVEETDVKLEKSEISMDKIATTIHDKGKEKESSTDIEIQLTLAIHKAFSTENQEVNCSSYWKDDQDSIRSKKGGDIDQNAGLHLPSKEIVGFLETTTRKHTSQVLEVTDSVEYCLPESARSSDALRTASVSGSLPLWELSLKSQLKGKDKDVLPEKHVLKHSEASAFSRYVNGGSPLFCPGSTVSNSYVKTKECGTSIRQRYSSDDNRSSIVFPLSERPSLSHVYGDETTTQCQLSSGRNKEDADPSPFLPSREDASVSPSPTAKMVPTHLQYGCAPVSIPVTANSFQTLCSTYGTVLQPFFYPESSVSFHGSVVATKELVAAPSKPSMDNCNKPQHVNGHFYHANHHSHQWFQGVDDQRTNVNPTHPRVVLHTPAEQIPVASGSNGAYGEKGFAANTGVAIESGSDRDRSRREAALNKFRLKRKDRCFEKKVRYHNRQKLAEQRPRIKGQFVRQTVGESNCGVAESDD